MRAKLTVKHPQPASPQRPPVRSTGLKREHDKREHDKRDHHAQPAAAQSDNRGARRDPGAAARPVSEGSNGASGRTAAAPARQRSNRGDAKTAPRAHAGAPGSKNAAGRANSAPTPAPRAQSPRQPDSAGRRAPKPAGAVPDAARAPAGKPPVDTASLRDAPGMLRLSKRMSELGLCSRREADEWIVKGWVRVDGVPVTVLGSKVSPTQRIELAPAARAAQLEQATILLHKPVGYVSGQPEDDHQPAVVLVTAATQWEADPSGIGFQHVHLRALAPAGRLDIDSTGLLVFTQDGRIAKQLIGENSVVEKEYLVRVRYGAHAQDIDSHFPADKLALLRHGLALDDVALKPAQVDWQNGEQLRFVLREGRKRQIRRMCELVGLEVVGLKRVRIGRVVLGALPAGQWRYLSAGEVF